MNNTQQWTKVEETHGTRFDTTVDGQQVHVRFIPSKRQTLAIWWMGSVEDVAKTQFGYTKMHKLDATIERQGDKVVRLVRNILAARS